MIELAFRTFGSEANPAIMLLHGLFGSASNWGSVARKLSDGFHVIVPDLRNHGQSPHDPVHDYPSMVADVLGVMDRLALSDVTLVGHSMGGKVAMHLALTVPQRVGRIAVVDMSPMHYSHNFNDVLQAFDAVDLRAIRHRADADKQISVYVAEPGVRAFLLQNLIKGTQQWSWRLNLAALSRHQSDLLAFPEQKAGASFGGPAAFIYGAKSDYVQPAYEPHIRRWFPQASMCEVANAGHWVYAEQPDGFMNCLNRFLD